MRQIRITACARTVSGLLVSSILAGASVAPGGTAAAEQTSVQSGAGADSAGVQALSDLPLEDLMNIEVTSVSKKRQKISDAPAAVYVITQEDIRRSGARSLPDVLRLAPGLEVARIDASKWAISARGFNWRWANKMLVLIDSRSVYTRLFSGVYWEMQDLPVSEIERIEVVRGPGGTLWGANAVNGVINVITKKATPAREYSVEGGGGPDDPAFGVAHAGGTMGRAAAYRVYAKYFEQDGLVDAAGVDTPDTWRMGRGRARIDWQPTRRDAVEFTGEGYRGRINSMQSLSLLDPPYQQPILDRANVWGWSTLGRWDHTISPTSELSLVGSYEGLERDEVLARQSMDILNFDFQHRLRLGAGNELLWGLGYRHEWFGIGDTWTISTDGAAQDDDLFNVFGQAMLPLLHDKLRLTLGSKFEYEQETGSAVQPNVRLLWAIGTHASAWTALSHAVRTPSQMERHARINLPAFPLPGGGTGVSGFFGNPDVKQEALTAYEVGYRTSPASDISLDLTAFFNRYDNLQTTEPGAPFQEGTPSPAHTVFPIYVENKLRGDTYGAEAAFEWHALRTWRLAGAATWLQMHFVLDPSSADQRSVQTSSAAPRFQLNLRSYLDVTDRLQLDLATYYVGKVSAWQVDDYVRLDSRLGFALVPGISLSAGVTNALQGRHREAGTDLLQYPTEIPRTVFGQATLQF
jgi:iron complex outermembrane receptor protein